MRKLIIGIGLAAAMCGLIAAPSATAESSTSDTASEVGPLVTVTIPARRIPVENRFIPPHVGGDREYDGNGPDVFASGTLLGVGTNRLRVRIFMDAIETKSDFTRARGTSPEFLIYVAPPGQCVQSVSRGTYDEIRYRDNDHGVDSFDGQVAGSFVNDWSFVGDTGGDEAGTETGAALTTFTFSANVQPC